MSKFVAGLVAAFALVTTWPFGSVSAADQSEEGQKKIQQTKPSQTKTSRTKTSQTKKRIVRTKVSNQNDAKEEKALALLLKRKEVIDWLKEFDGPDDKSPSTGGHAVWRFNGHDKDVYTIQGVEVMDDHDVTFGWYHVNLRTGVVTKEN